MELGKIRLVGFIDVSVPFSWYVGPRIGSISNHSAVAMHKRSTLERPTKLVDAMSSLADLYT